LPDVWQARIQVLALLLLWLRCCGLTTHSRNYNRNVLLKSKNNYELRSMLHSRSHPCVAEQSFVL